MMQSIIGKKYLGSHVCSYHTPMFFHPSPTKIHQSMWIQWQIVMWSSKISWKSEILILIYSQTKAIIFFVSFFFFQPSTALIPGTRCPILMGFSAKCSFVNSICNQVEKLKMNFPYFRLILLDLPQLCISWPFGVNDPRLPLDDFWVGITCVLIPQYPSVEVP